VFLKDTGSVYSIALRAKEIIGRLLFSRLRIFEFTEKLIQVSGSCKSRQKNKKFDPKQNLFANYFETCS